MIPFFERHYADPGDEREYGNQTPCSHEATFAEMPEVIRSPDGQSVMLVPALIPCLKPGSLDLEENGILNIVPTDIHASVERAGQNRQKSDDDDKSFHLPSDQWSEYLNKVMD